MSFYDVWSWFGFNDNPYSEITLQPDETGHQLIVGRDAELTKISRRIGSSGNQLAVEGPVGAGKTSLVNVAAFRMARHSLDLKAKRLFVPAVQPLQVSLDINEFERNFYHVIAQTLIHWQDSFEAADLKRPNLALLNKWLNAPEYTGTEGGIGVAGFSGQYGTSSEPNTSSGFEEFGFQTLVLKSVKEAFPAGTGGIVCILDNLEILETTGAAVDVIGILRDKLFGISQVRWVVCGSRGIVSRVVRADRVSGFFQAPIVLDRLTGDAAVDAVSRRLNFYGQSESVAPVTPEGFKYVYEILNRSMRDALACAQEFSFHLADEFEKRTDLPGEEGRLSLLRSWISERGEKMLEDAASVQPRHWQFFDDLCASGGRVGSSKFKEFGFNKQQQLTAAVSSLASTHLLVREIDPDDGHRTINVVTSTGWLVHHARVSA